MAGGDGFGRDLSDDPFGGPASARPSKRAEPSDAGPRGAGRMLGDPFEGLGDAPSRTVGDPFGEPETRGPRARGDRPDPASAGGGRVIGDPFDGLGDPGELPALELDEPAPRPAPAAETPRPSPTPIGAVGASSPGTVATPAERLTDPTIRGEVLELADYGPPPRNPLGAVPYAVLVLTRQQALRKARRGLLSLRGRARADAEEALVDLGRALHAMKSAPEVAAFGGLVTVADQRGEAAGAKSAAWAQSREVSDTQRESLERKTAEVEEKAGPYRDRETKLATQMDVRATDLRRAKARLQRVEIELRNVAASEPPDPARVELLTAERDARRADVETAQGHVDALAPPLAEARRELAVMVQALNDLEAQKRAVHQAQNREEKKHLSSASAAEREYHAAVIELATEALTRGAAEEVTPEEAKKARLMIRARAARDREVELHDAALIAYDRRAFQQGVAALAIAGTIILAMVLFVILR